MEITMIRVHSESVDTCRSDQSIHAMIGTQVLTITLNTHTNQQQLRELLLYIYINRVALSLVQRST